MINNILESATEQAPALVALVFLVLVFTRAFMGYVREVNRRHQDQMREMRNEHEKVLVSVIAKMNEVVSRNDALYERCLKTLVKVEMLLEAKHGQ